MNKRASTKKVEIDCEDLFDLSFPHESLMAEEEAMVGMMSGMVEASRDQQKMVYP